MATGPVIPRPDQCQHCGKTYMRAARRQRSCSPLCQATLCYNEKVIRRGVDECWGWSGFKHKGYGRLRYGEKSVGVHRMSYELHIGAIPDGLTVLHDCDNPECSNPAHLSLGTNADNNRDRDRKGRQAVGQDCSSSRLSEAAVRDIRDNLIRGKYGEVTAFARKYGTTRNAVYSVLERQSWNHVA